MKTVQKTKRPKYPETRVQKIMLARDIRGSDGGAMPFTSCTDDTVEIPAVKISSRCRQLRPPNEPDSDTNIRGSALNENRPENQTAEVPRDTYTEKHAELRVAGQKWDETVWNSAMDAGRGSGIARSRQDLAIPGNQEGHV